MRFRTERIDRFGNRIGKWQISFADWVELCRAMVASRSPLGVRQAAAGSAPGCESLVEQAG